MLTAGRGENGATAVVVVPGAGSRVAGVITGIAVAGINPPGMTAVG
jgi:hypothetical protein